MADHCSIAQDQTATDTRLGKMHKFEKLQLKHAIERNCGEEIYATTLKRVPKTWDRQ